MNTKAKYSLLAVFLVILLAGGFGVVGARGLDDNQRSGVLGKLNFRDSLEAEKSSDDSSRSILDDSAGDELEIFGTVMSVASGVWTIDNQAVLIQGSTEIKGIIALGDRVKVHASLDAAGNLVAREIELASADDMEDDDNMDDLGDDQDDDLNDDHGNDQGEDLNDDHGDGSHSTDDSMLKSTLDDGPRNNGAMNNGQFFDDHGANRGRDGNDD